MQSPDSVALPAVAHPRRFIAFFSVLAVVASAAFAAGSFVRAPQQSALDAASDHLDVTYAVEERVVAPGIAISGRVVPGETEQLLPSAGAAGRIVVTQQSLAPGQVITPGTLLGEVSGRPQISIPEGVPLYRDLVDGSTGADVSAFQSALLGLGLDVSATGEVGPRTLAAVSELYGRFPVAPASETVIVWTDFLPVAAGSTVVSAAGVGAVLTEEVPLATVTVSPDVVVARANVLEADQLSTGQEVQLRSGSAVASSIVVNVGEFTIPDDDSGPGRDITVGIPAEFEVAASAPITVSTEGDVRPGPAVPTIALRQDEEGTYVELPRAEGGTSSSKRERVYVTVIAQAAGWAAVESDRLAIGDKVYVSP